jgi:hypothetical protein
MREAALDHLVVTLHLSRPHEGSLKTRTVTLVPSAPFSLEPQTVNVLSINDAFIVEIQTAPISDFKKHLPKPLRTIESFARLEALNLLYQAYLEFQKKALDLFHNNEEFYENLLSINDLKELFDIYNTSYTACKLDSESKDDDYLLSKALDTRKLYFFAVLIRVEVALNRKGIFSDQVL